MERHFPIKPGQPSGIVFPFCIPLPRRLREPYLRSRKTLAMGCYILESSIFLRLTLELAGKYALIGIFCLFRYVRWYVGYVIS